MFISRIFKLKRLCLRLSASALFLALGSGWGAPTQAAETINLVIGSSSSSSTSGIPLPVADLRTYAETQQPSSQLSSLLSFVSPQQQTDLLKGLQTTLPVDPNNLQQVLDSDKGKQILSSAAAATLRPDQAGVDALRTALMASAASPKGFGFLTFLEAYPDPVVNIDLMQMQQLLTMNESLLAQLGQDIKPEAATTAAPSEVPPAPPSANPQPAATTTPSTTTP